MGKIRKSRTILHTKPAPSQYHHPSDEERSTKTKSDKRNARRANLLNRLQLPADQAKLCSIIRSGESLGELADSLSVVATTRQTVKNKATRECSANEVTHFQAVLSNPTFQQDPFGSISQHLINKQAQQKKAEADTVALAKSIQEVSERAKASVIKGRAQHGTVK